MDIILALDLGKFKTVGCRITSDTSERERFYTVRSLPDQIARLLHAVKPTLLVLEACSLSGWIVDMAREWKIAYVVAHPGEDAWQWNKVKRKTDRDDALKLAKLARSGELNSVHIPNAKHRQFQRLVRHRKRIQSYLNRVQNAIRELIMHEGVVFENIPKPLNKQFVEQRLSGACQPLAQCRPENLWRGILQNHVDMFKALHLQLVEVERCLAEITANDERVQLVQTIPGVGPVGAQTIVAHLDDAARFKSPGQVSAYAGLVPKKWQSGNTDRQNKISKRGPRLLRATLVEVAWISIRYNESFKSFFERVRGGSKARKKQACVALARKILVIAWTMLKNNEPWREPAKPGSEAPSPGQMCPTSS
jgi:transposase